ncbi:MAG: two-component sensor histidine kinase [Balneola sp.]|nr:two-component sensor histidine kinase [Balneola sp.]
MKLNRFLRWGLFSLSLSAILILTAMNVYTLYEVRDTLIEGEQKKQIALLDEIALNVRRTIYRPYRGFNTLELEPIKGSLELNGQFPEQIREKLVQVAESPVFNGVYYTPADIDPCIEGSRVYELDRGSTLLSLTDNYPQILCDGVGLVRTKARIELNNFDYRWNTNTEFDAHRSMNIGFINLHENSVIGYLTAIIDQSYLIEEVIAPEIQQYFDSSKTTSVVWLHDWANDVVLATNNNKIPFEIEEVQKRVDFGRMFENWNLKIAFLDNASVKLYNATFTKNIIVLGFSAFLLLGALFYIFYTAQKERSILQQQTDFLANVTHELKTPLAVMQAAGENISDGRVSQPKRLKEYGAHIYQESVRLNKMIEMLLDVARSDYGTTLIHAKPYDLSDLVREILLQQKSLIMKKGHSLTHNLNLEYATVLVDPEHIKIILTNLIDNAIKYSVAPSIIHIELKAEKDGYNLIVKDQGIGIPRSHIKNIFKKFYRVEDSLSAKTKGHGLGLSIVQGLMQLNKGTIKVKSEKTSGSIFTCYFPKYYQDSSDSITKMSKNSNSSGSTQRNNHLSTETMV